MEVSTRVIAALRKDSRERNIEDFNAIFEFFVQVIRIKLSLIHFAHLHFTRRLNLNNQLNNKFQLNKNVNFMPFITE